MEIKLIFEKPYFISPLMIPDQMQVRFNGSQQFLKSLKHNNALHVSSWLLKSPIQK